MAIVVPINVMQNLKEQWQECREQSWEENLCQVVINAEELTTTSVVGQSISESYDLPTFVEPSSGPPTGPILLHMVAPLDLPMERDTSIENIVLVEDVSDEEEAEMGMGVTFKDPIDIIIPLNGSSQSIDETKVEEPNLPNNPSVDEPSQLDIDMKIEDCAGPPIHHPPLAW